MANFDLGCAIILAFLIIVFMVSVLLDQPRKYLWSLISKYF